MTETTKLQIRAGADTCKAIADVVSKGQLVLTGAGEEFNQTFAMAAAMRQLNELITDSMMMDIMELQGKSCGFRTDKDKTGGYPVAVVRRCFIEATLSGARSIDNEWNIIAEKPYYTKNYFLRKVRTFEGLTNLVYSNGEIENRGGNAFVDYIAAWELNGRPMELKRVHKKLVDGTPFDDRLVVRVNTGMGYDAIIGKATRKMFHAIYSLLASYVPPEGDVSDIIDVEPQKRVQQSSLFADVPVATEQPSQPDSAEEETILKEYDESISLAEKSEVGDIAKLAGRDERLTEAGKKRVMAMCSKRRSRKNKD